MFSDSRLGMVGVGALFLLKQAELSLFCWADRTTHGIAVNAPQRKKGDGWQSASSG
jgi:hypothetical protein